MSKPELVVARRKVTELDCCAALGRRISAHLRWEDGVTSVAKGVVVGVLWPAPGSGICPELMIREFGKSVKKHDYGFHYEIYADTITKLQVYEEVDIAKMDAMIANVVPLR